MNIVSKEIYGALADYLNKRIAPLEKTLGENESVDVFVTTGIFRLDLSLYYKRCGISYTIKGEPCKIKDYISCIDKFVEEVKEKRSKCVKTLNERLEELEKERESIEKEIHEIIG